MAAELTCEPLPRSRPLWSATFVTGLADSGTGLILVMHHVLADSIGGLALLARLADDSTYLPPATPQAARFAVPAPGPDARRRHLGGHGPPPHPPGR